MANTRHSSLSGCVVQHFIVRHGHIYTRQFHGTLTANWPFPGGGRLSTLLFKHSSLCACCILRPFLLLAYPPCELWHLACIPTYTFLEYDLAILKSQFAKSQFGAKQVQHLPCVFAPCDPGPGKQKQTSRQCLLSQMETRSFRGSFESHKKRSCHLLEKYVPPTNWRRPSID